MICCEQCFADELLKERVRQDGFKGDCDVCGATDVHCIDASELTGDFEGLVSLYEPVEYGTHFHKEFGPDAWQISDTLPNCIDEDGWGVFSDELTDDQRCRLLDEIRQVSRLHDGCVVPSHELWTSPEHRLWHVSEEQMWREFCDYIKYERRYIRGKTSSPQHISDPADWLPAFLAGVEKDLEKGTKLFRARRVNPTDQDSAYPADKMGPPPREKAASGRANAPGIVVLYAAQEKETAIGEMRASVGARVTVATLHTKKDLVVADLSSMPYIPSAFTPLPSGDYTLGELVVQNRFLRCVNSALARPVQPDEKEIEYVPTQYVAEVVNNAAYAGIVYTSSLVKGGHNIVLFDADVVEIDSDTELVEITSVSCESTPVKVT